VHKPAEQSPLSALLFAHLCLEAGVPEGVVNVVSGDGETGAALAAHMDVDKVAFTGSVETGQKIIQASMGNIKRLTLELGGKSPDIVFADADLDAAVAGASNAIFGNSGQICAAGSRLFVERRIYDEFVERVAAFGRGLKVGDPLAAGTDMGPVVSAEQLDRVLGYIESGREQGAEVLIGGERLGGAEYANGFYVPPTVFTDVGDDMRIAQEEIFGPVLCAVPFDDLDEVIARANATSFGLAAGVWTKDVGTAHQVAARLKCGCVWVNTFSMLEGGVPFGGYKMSGYGRELGPEQLDEYTNLKTVWIKTA
jgi:aldehyde dehydrogenase (NAD+)